MGGEVFLADSRTNRRTDERADMTNLTVAFLNLATGSKNYQIA